MNSLIFRTATRFLQPLLFLYSIFLLFYGHHIPGGGFSGGLIASTPFILQALAYDVPSARRLLRVTPHTLMGMGLLLAMGSGLIAFFSGSPFLTGIWGKWDVSGFGLIEIGSPLIFDIGVYVLVLGTTLIIFLHLAEE